MHYRFFFLKEYMHYRCDVPICVALVVTSAKVNFTLSDGELF